MSTQPQPHSLSKNGSQIKTTILSIGVGITIAIGAMTVYSQQLDKEHEAKIQAYTITDTNEKTQADYEAIYRLAYRRQGYADSVASSTKRVANLPASAERTAYSAAVVKAIADNVITDDEYDKLEADYHALEFKNKVDEVNQMVAKYVPETNTVKKS